MVETKDQQFPGIKWAQRKESIFMTIEVADCENPTIELTEEGILTFKGVSHETTYGFTMEFFAPIVKADSKFNTKGRNPIITIQKEDQEAEYWPRIMKEKVKNSRITVDWNKWVDEDEQDGAADMDAGMDPSAMSQFGGAGGMPPGMGGMGGMPGMGGMGGMPGMGGMGGMPGMGGMGGMPGGMGGMPGMGGMGGMDMEALMKQMGGMGGAAGMPDSDDDEEEEEEAAGEPVADADGLGDLDAEEEKK